MTTVNRLSPTRDDAARAAEFLREVDHVLAVLDDVPDRGEDAAEIDALVAEREAARGARDYARADAIRDELAARGIEILDTRDGTRWRRS